MIPVALFAVLAVPAVILLAGAVLVFFAVLLSGETVKGLFRILRRMTASSGK